MTEVSQHDISPPGKSAEAPILGLGDQAHFQRYQQRSNKLLWGIFVLLLVLVGGVIFVLPNYVAPPDPGTVVVVPTASTPAAPALSPFEEAQKMRQREAAQNALAALLELQEELETKQVQDWAAAPFASAIEQAHKGDDAYRQQQFVEAENFYKAGADALQALKDGEPAMYAKFLADANAAFAAGDALSASEAFGQALLIDPSSSEALAGMQRADVLNDVMDLLDAGRKLQDDNQFESAREAYQRAQALDAEHPAVAAALQEVNAAIADRDFAVAMSRGYSALQSGDSTAALRAFDQAGAMRPGSAEVAAAQQQARDRQTFDAISVHIDAALMHEDNEEWAQAVAEWDQVLAVDANLVDAVQGRERSESRRVLDDFLQNTIANPLRLAEPEIYAQTRQVVADATRMLQAGPRLRGQLEQIDGFLERALVPVDVQLQSDGMTMVTVYRVAELGMFTSQTLSLPPGAYVAVGVRAGYRDVRQEFVVGLDGHAPVVTVACNEAI
jgi:tetratricopeptide (TPR) repeat protein